MRSTIIACLMLSLALTLPGTAQSGKRRAVRKSPPAGPVAVADSFAVLRGGTLIVNAAQGVLANDTDPQAKPLTATLVTFAAHGTLALNPDGGFLYVNDSSSATTDSFTYKASNGTLETSPATVTITINNPPPQAAADAYTANQNTTLTVPAPGVLENDTLHQAAITTFGASGTEQATLGATTPTAAGGSVRVDADGSFVYNPAGGFSGSDNFTYVLANATGTSSATVTITVQASNAIDFTVTSPGFFFQFSGLATGVNPVLTLTRGRTYRFRINTTAIHPFEILDAPPGSVTNNNISNGTLTFTVPPGEGNYRYHCTFHGFGNDINSTP